MTVTEKKKKIIKMVSEVFDLVDKSGRNSERFKKLIEPMSERKLTEFMNMLKNKQWQISMELPNLESHADMNDVLKAADKVGAKIFHRLKMTEPSTGKTIVTTEEYPILSLMIRRTQQAIDKKRSLPSGDSKIDALTGQVTGADQASAVSKEEISILYSRGLTETLRELTQIRGGNPELFAELKQQLEETGNANVDTHDPNDRTRVAVMTDVLFRGMHIGTNIITE